MPASLLRRHRQYKLSDMMVNQWGYCDVESLVRDQRQEVWIHRDTIVDYDWAEDSCHILVRPDGIELKLPDDFDPSECPEVPDPSPDDFLPVYDIF